METLITNDYVGMAIQNNIKLEKIYLESVLDVLDSERLFMEECLEAGMITLEAIEKTEVEITKKRNIIDRIFDALEALFGKFKEKIVILSDRNSQWLNKNLVYITKDNLSKLPQFEAYPLWERNYQAIMNDLRNLTTGLINQTKVKQPDMKGIEEVVRKTIGGKNDIGKDAIVYFRSGKAGENLKPITTNGAALVKYLEGMYTYAVKYDKIVVPAVQKYMNQLKNVVKTIAPPESVSESFCYLEGVNYSDTLIGLLPNMYGAPVLEETEDTQMKNGKINDNQKNEEGPKSVTSIKMTGNNDSEQNGKPIHDTQYVKDITNVLKILQGAALTVLEEQYLLFIAIFKAVLQNEGVKTKENNEAKKDNETKK